MRLNPIVKKDIKVQSRSMKICWGIFAYEVILALIFFFAMMIIQMESRYSYNNIYSSMVWLYPILAVTQLVILGFVIPIRTASSISGEKERQTFDIMMTTSMTPFAIIMGKVMTAIVQSMFFVVASMPIMALPFIIGGMSWGYLFWFLGIALLVSLFAASIGILCSSICKKSISAVIMAYGIYLIFFIATWLPYIVYQVAEADSRYLTVSSSRTYGYGENLYLFLLLNPFIYVAEFFAKVMTGESLAQEMLDTFCLAHPCGPVEYIAEGNHWIVVSTVLFLAVSLLFLWLASVRIDPVRSSRKKKAAGNKGER